MFKPKILLIISLSLFTFSHFSYAVPETVFSISCRTLNSNDVYSYSVKSSELRYRKLAKKMISASPIYLGEELNAAGNYQAPNKAPGARVVHSKATPSNILLAGVGNPDHFFGFILSVSLNIQYNQDGETSLNTVHLSNRILDTNDNECSTEDYRHCDSVLITNDEGNAMGLPAICKSSNISLTSKP